MIEFFYNMRYIFESQSNVSTTIIVNLGRAKNRAVP